MKSMDMKRALRSRLGDNLDELAPVGFVFLHTVFHVCGLKFLDRPTWHFTLAISAAVGRRTGGQNKDNAQAVNGQRKAVILSQRVRSIIVRPLLDTVRCGALATLEHV